MDRLKLEVLQDKKKEILKQLVQQEFNIRLNKSVFVLNDKTLQMLKKQVEIIDGMINEELKK